MLRARLGFIAVFVVGCTVAAGDGATFGATGADASTSGSSTPASGGGATDAPGSGDEGEEAGSGDPGSTSAGTTDFGSEATSDPGSESGVGSEADSSSEGGPPLQEHDYGPCTGGDPKSPCGDDAECIVVEGLNGSFCSPWCDAELACPEPTAGEAFAQCQLGPDLEMPPVHCALLCDPGSDECPDGMTCVETGMPIGVCLFVG